MSEIIFQNICLLFILKMCEQLCLANEFRIVLSRFRFRLVDIFLPDWYYAENNAIECCVIYYLYLKNGLHWIYLFFNHALLYLIYVI